MDLTRYGLGLLNEFDDSISHLNLLRDSMWRDANKALRLRGLPSDKRLKMVDIRMNLHENDNQYRYDLEIPGLSKEDIHIDEDNGTITVHGEKKLKHEENKDGYHFVETNYGSFKRTFRLPDNVNHDSMKAEFYNGLLTLTIDKLEGKATRKININ